MAKMKFQFLFLVGVIALASCSSISFTSDKDPDADFRQYKTLSYYGWADESSKVLNQLEKTRIETAFADEFKKRGISIQETGGDIIVSLYIVVDQKTGVTAYNNYYGAGPYGYRGGWAYYKCQEYCGSSPRDKKSVPAMQPTPEILGWIKHKNIQNAKRRSVA